MSRKKKKGKKKLTAIEIILLATAIIQLINAILEIVNKLT